MTVRGVTRISDVLQPAHIFLIATPEQLIERAESGARSLGVESQQLLPKRKILQHEVLSGSKSTNQPTEKVSE
jgi:hypothetical protein